MRGRYDQAESVSQMEKGWRQKYFAKRLAESGLNEAASNGGVLHDSLQNLHAHVLFAAPLGTGHMAHPGTDQHKGRIAVWERPSHPCPAADPRFSRSMTWFVRIGIQWIG